MKLALRRIGNSLGVIITKAALDAWGLGAGDALDLTERGIQPAAGRITGERRFVIIGSQSLHGKYPDLADAILLSAEVDLIASKRPEQTELLNEIGVASPFHQAFGYYADPVDVTTTTLPRGWKG